MKKILAIAVAAFAFAACGGGNGGSTSSNVEPLKDGVSFETDTYSVMVPTGMEETFRYENTLNLKTPDGDVKFVINHFTGGPTKSQLKMTGDGLKGMVHALDQNCKSDEPKVDGNMVTLRTITEGNVRLDFTYLKEDKVGVTGNYEFPESQAADWEGKFLPILKSVVFK